jgi:glycosyltransferase involved in cell wall biosynthesis
MYQNKISILIATRNEEENVNELLSSLLNQNFSGFTIIITDRSTDKTLEAVKDFIDRERDLLLKKSVKIIPLAWNEDKNYIKGRIGQFQNALDLLSETEFIALMDADAIYPEDYLNASFYSISKGYDLITSGFTLPKKERIVHFMDELDNKFLTLMGQAAIDLKLRGWMLGASAFFKKSAFDEIGGYNNIEHFIMDDFALANKFFKHGKKIGYFNDRTKIVRLRSDPKPVQQKLRWNNALWAESNIGSKIVTLGIAIIPLIIYLLTLGGITIKLMDYSALNFLGFSLDLIFLAGLIMFLIDFSIVIYLLFKTRTNLLWFPLYFLWINFTSRILIPLSFFKKSYTWRLESRSQY